MHCLILFSFSHKSLKNAEYIALVGLLGRNPLWCSSMIFIAYGFNLDNRMLDKILYVADKSDMLL
jgi:hypothetical protein